MTAARLEREGPTAAAIEAAYAVSERREGESRTDCLVRALRVAYAVDRPSPGRGIIGALADLQEAGRRLSEPSIPAPMLTVERLAALLWEGYTEAECWQDNGPAGGSRLDATKFAAWLLPRLANVMNA